MGHPVGWHFGDGKLGVSFLRLRTVSDRHYVALKQPAENAQARRAESRPGQRQG